MLDGITWFRQSSVRIRRVGVELHVDPWGIKEESDADFILLTHPHYDTFSEDDIARVRGPNTIVVAPVSMRKQMDQIDHLMRPGDMVSLDGIDILAVPAFNTEKKFHPPEAGWLGYVFTIGETTFYHAGDTDLLDSMSDIRCDVAFLPCDRKYTMGPEDAARAAEACEAHVVIPVHWGGHAESRRNAERVADLFSGEVHLLEMGMPS
jgi:L-ascorbate metabolism protein UlaG (beta-lactamase superfamily)